MPLPVAFPLASFLTRAGITALGTGAATEGIKSLQNQGVVNPNMAQQALMRTIMGPTSEIFNRITDTPSGKVFAPDATDIEKQRKEAISKPLITPMPVGQQDQTLATPVPEKTTVLPGMGVAEQIDSTLSTPDAVEGKIDTSILTKEAADYRLQHKPKGPEDEYPVRLDDLTQTTTGEPAGYPKDFYSEKGKRIYAPGQSFKNDEYGIANHESYNIINSVRGNPESEVIIYRAVPNSEDITEINSGDFITISKRYADLHAAGGYGRDGTDKGKVLEKTVKVKEIYWDQNDVNEFGYFPKEESTNISKQTDAPGEEENTSKSAGSLTEEVLKKVPANKENFKFDYEYNTENKKFRFMRIPTTSAGDNYKVINYNESAKYDQDYYNVIGASKNLNQAKTIANEFTTSENTSKSAGSLTEVSTNPSEPFDSMDTSAVDFFPFNPVDFKKNGILNNPEIVKAFDDLKNDVKIKPPVGFNEDYMALQQSDSFYLTPPRAQMEITLKYLEKQLEENKASEETLNLIKNLNKDLQAKIKDTGYYAENKKVEDRITNLPGMTNKLKNLKSSN